MKRWPKVVVFQSDDDGMWYWHLKASNVKIVAQGEGHKRKADAIRAVERVMTLFCESPEIEVLEVK